MTVCSTITSALAPPLSVNIALKSRINCIIGGPLGGATIAASMHLCEENRQMVGWNEFTVSYMSYIRSCMPYICCSFSFWCCVSTRLMTIYFLVISCAYSALIWSVFVTRIYISDAIFGQERFINSHLICTKECNACR